MKISIWGFGVTGRGILEYFVDKGCEIHVYDPSPNLDIPQYENVSFFNINEIKDIGSYDMLFISPGISKNTETVQRAYEAGVKVYNDVSYFVEKMRGKVTLIGVTGSNGKSTTVSLLQHVLEGLGKKSILVGNIGNSPMQYLREFDEGEEFEYVVLELSSFQLEIFNDQQYVDIGVFTNLTPNHLDRHQGDMQVYANEKMNMFGGGSKIITTSSSEGVSKYVLPNISDFVDVSLEDLDEFYFSDSIRLKGDHNKFNIAFVLEVLKLLDINDDVSDLISSFGGLEHRVEFVREVDGVEYYNDSKSTSPEATITALNALGDVNNIVLIAGGTDKGVGYGSWVDPLNLYVKHMVILDHDINEKLIDACKKSNTEYTVAGDIHEAVKKASEVSESRDTVLLSPGSASFGMFLNFEDRGKKYKGEVMGL